MLVDQQAPIAPDTILNQVDKADKSDKSAKDAAEAELERQCQALDVPGYSVETDGVFTVIRRTTKTGRSATFPARMARCVHGIC